jgi:hypothetical protein
MADVDTLIANARSYADSAVSEGVYWIQKISELTDLLNELVFVTGQPTWSYTEVSNRAFEALSIVQTEQPPRPTGLDDITIEQPPAFTPPSTTSLDNILRTMISIISPIPDKFIQAAAMFDAVNSKVLSDLITGGYGIDPADEILLWERGRDRAIEMMDMEIDEVQNRFAAYGIPIPQGALTKEIQVAIDKAQDALYDLNKDILIKRADLYRTQRNFSIEKSIQLVTTGLEFTKTKVQVLRDAVLAELEIIKAEVELNKELLAVYGYRLDALVKTKGLAVDVYKADIEAFNARLGALVRAYGVLQSANSDQLNADRLSMIESMERVKNQIAAFHVESGLKSTALSDIVQIFAHKVAGALSSLNTLVQQAEIKNITG